MPVVRACVLVRAHAFVPLSRLHARASGHTLVRAAYGAVQTNEIEAATSERSGCAHTATTACAARRACASRRRRTRTRARQTRRSRPTARTCRWAVRVATRIVHRMLCAHHADIMRIQCLYSSYAVRIGILALQGLNLAASPLASHDHACACARARLSIRVCVRV